MVLEEIVVTAQKREQSIQDVPIAITAMDGNLLENNGANNLTDLHGIAPNVVLTEIGLIPNIGKVAIRGIAFLDPDPNADPKTGISIDGVPLTRNAGILNDAFDIERVEILRGPQGTLFGRNNLAGTISMVSARPTEDPGGKIKLTLGENGLRTVRATANSGSFADAGFSRKIAGVPALRGYTRRLHRQRFGETRQMRRLPGLRKHRSMRPIADWTEANVIVGIPPHTRPGRHRVDGDKSPSTEPGGFSDLETGARQLESNLETDIGLRPWSPPPRDIEYFTSATSTASSARCRSTHSVPLDRRTH